MGKERTTQIEHCREISGKPREISKSIPDLNKEEMSSWTMGKYTAYS